MAKISTVAKRELVEAVSARYRTGTADEKRRILDEFVALTGYHRKHAIRVLRASSVGREKSIARRRSSVYDEAVQEALRVLWEASDRVCGKRLKALVPVLLPALERHGHIRLDDVVRSQVFAVSAATMDRVLAGARAASGRRRVHVAKPAVRRSVPIRTFADWDDPAPGYLEGDLVAHGGESMAGSFVYTFTLTDIATGWIECIPLLVREATLVVDALDRLRTVVPFPIRGIDTDNGSEFVNEAMLTYCAEKGIEFTRSRPYRKNDQAWVEQKNGSVVRRLVGYRRLEGIRAAEALARLYSASRLFVNFFQPSFKLAEKTRVGARVSKRYHSPETPCARLLSSPTISEPVKERLRAVMATLDPLRLLDEIRTVQAHLVELAAGKPAHLPHRDADLERFMKSLALAWKEGNPRPTHRTQPKPARHWRTRIDPFEAVWPRIIGWLEAEPDRTAKELLERLRQESPRIFAQGQLRTLQRRVKAWRRLAARRLVFADDGPPLTALKDPGAISVRQSGSIRT